MGSTHAEALWPHAAESSSQEGGTVAAQQVGKGTQHLAQVLRTLLNPCNAPNTGHLCSLRARTPQICDQINRDPMETSETQTPC